MEQLMVGICEDNREERVRLLDMVTEAAEKVTVEAFSSAEEFLKSYYPGKYDLIILDIYMEGMSGIEALETVRKTDSRVEAAIETTSQDFALESYRLRAARYLEKPVKMEDVSELIQSVIRKKEAEPHLEVESEGSRVRIPFDRILFVEQKGKMLWIHMDDEREIPFRGRLDDEEQKFPSGQFLRCHKSFLVNLSKIRGIDRELLTFVMEDGQNVHIHRQGFFNAKRTYEQYLYSIAEGWKNR